MAKELPCFRVFVDNGTSYNTSMAEGVTLEDARKYLVGNRLEITETEFAHVVRVEEEGGLTNTMLKASEAAKNNHILAFVYQCGPNKFTYCFVREYPELGVLVARIGADGVSL